MSLLDILYHEHEIFLKIIDRMERSFKYDEATVRDELRDAFLILLPALQKHEHIENLIFSHPARASRGPAKKLMAEIEAQHRKIKSLKTELQKALADSDHSSL